MKIGELARRTGLAASRIRFYEASGLLEPARRTGRGAGEGTLFVAEQFAFNQLRRNCRTVYLYHWSSGTFALRMNGVCYQFFSGSVWSCNHNSCIRWSDFINDFLDSFQCRRITNHLVFLVHLFLKLIVFLLQVLIVLLKITFV